MPRIDAPTVAEHHARRQADLVEAAVRLLTREGAAAVTPAAVASAAGLARSSVYQYYPSTGALLGAAVIETFHRALATITAAVDAHPGAAERVGAYVAASVDAAANGHLPTGPVPTGDLPQECREGIVRLHDELGEPLITALAALGVDDPAGTAALVHGVVRAAAGRVERGEPLESVRAAAESFVTAALAGREPLLLTP
jgi:AcrR family transcriptional regulator